MKMFFTIHFGKDNALSFWYLEKANIFFAINGGIIHCRLGIPSRKFPCVLSVPALILICEIYPDTRAFLLAKSLSVSRRFRVSFDDYANQLDLQNNTVLKDLERKAVILHELKRQERMA